jgi:hypothetical protein
MGRCRGKEFPAVVPSREGSRMTEPALPDSDRDAVTEMNELTTEDFDFSWLHSNSAKVALIEGGREIRKKATDHTMLTMDLAKAYYEQKKRLLNASGERLTASRARRKL